MLSELNSFVWRGLTLIPFNSHNNPKVDSNVTSTLHSRKQRGKC